MKTISKNFFVSRLLVGVAFLSLALGGLILGMNIPKIQNEIATYMDGRKNQKEAVRIQQLQEMVTPKSGFTLPISWGNFGSTLINAGVIDESKFKQAVLLTDDQKNILEKGADMDIKIDSSNSQFVVDLLWAIGLAQESDVYTQGPLGTQYKSEQGNFASTGGWTLAKGDAVNYLNKFDLIQLTQDQQNRVSEISKNIYRPCCDNPTWFPDCNHGMAALAAIEMMVAKNLSDSEIYSNVLKLNSFWFPDSYLTTAVYFDRQGISWDKIDAKKVLGQEYSSATGASLVAKKVGPLPGQSVNGGSCGA